MTAEAEVLPAQGQDVLTLVFENPKIAILDEMKARIFIDRVREEAAKVGTPDVETSAGRAEIRAMASKVVKTRTMLDAARLEMTKGLRQQVDDINAAGKIITSELREIAEETRKPLTDWEDAEKARENRCNEIMEWLRQAAIVKLDDTAETVRERGTKVFETEITKEQFRKQALDALELKDRAIAALREALTRLEREEQEKAELEEELRRLKAERDEADRKAREAQEREARQVEYARSIIQHIRDCGNGMIGGKAYPFPILIRELEEKVVIDDAFGVLKAEAETVLAENLAKLREAFDRHMAAEKEQRAEEAREEARREVEAAAQREIDAANARAEEAERAAQAERDRIAQEERERQQQAEREAEELAERERSRSNRRKIMGEMKVAMMKIGAISEDQASAIVKGMVKGEIPHASVQF